MFVQKEASHPEPEPLLTAPNVLTMLRVVLVPVFVCLWFSSAHYAPAAAALVFIAASITDWLDGYLARLVCPPLLRRVHQTYVVSRSLYLEP